MCHLMREFDSYQVTDGFSIANLGHYRKGAIVKDDVILGADTRATSSLVPSKGCLKLHHLSNKIYCAGAGTAADCGMGTMESQLALHALYTKREPRFWTLIRILKQYLYRYQGTHRVTS
ncbi:proteasome (prosome macropain) subunit beta type 10 isoform CRA_b-like [Tropilaelaps mercedesae]|uniref:Proteasome (Prosome macropain) subunit beta type 10 isoform CRA_b-like n=1 Tax=Tropilaelaps mercedesae TaxID=418985 RepID=A0A1V9XY64_9ACAR|nr:proteasome (prosome macropain) subunit beta type 10 isoform CRA_b-like [Tropilaelaps mercedesae]